MKNNNTITNWAKVISGLFNPFMIPTIAILILFLFTYLRIMPIQYKLIVLGIVYSFTVLMPVLAIYLFKRVIGWTDDDFNDRKNRHIPYMLTIASYSFCLVLMYKMKIPYYMIGIIVGGFFAIAIGVIINIRWKVSEHMIGVGCVVGGLIAFGFLFSFNPVWWLCILILISGMLATSRILLGHHTLGQVLVGFVIGFCSAIYGILYF